MPIRYECQGRVSRVPGGGSIIKIQRGPDVVRDFAARKLTVVPPFTGAGASPSANQPTAGYAVDRLIELVGRLADRMGINLLDVIEPHELQERYSAVNTKD